MRPNVHDAFFKAMLSRPEHAASLLKDILGSKIAARIDFASLAPCAGSYVDQALKERFSDLLFRGEARRAPGVDLPALRAPEQRDARMAFRLLRYMVRIWVPWTQPTKATRQWDRVLDLDVAARHYVRLSNIFHTKMPDTSVT